MSKSNKLVNAALAGLAAAKANSKRQRVCRQKPAKSMMQTPFCKIT